MVIGLLHQLVDQGYDRGVSSRAWCFSAWSIDQHIYQVPGISFLCRVVRIFVAGSEYLPGRLFCLRSFMFDFWMSRRIFLFLVICSNFVDFATFEAFPLFFSLNFFYAFRRIFTRGIITIIRKYYYYTKAQLFVYHQSEWWAAMGNLLCLGSNLGVGRDGKSLYLKSCCSIPGWWLSIKDFEHYYYI